MVIRAHTKKEIFGILSVTPDPEITVVNIEEMGMLRDVLITAEGYQIILSPTYTGCPAMSIIEQDIKMTLNANGVSPVAVNLVYDPACTTDWMSDTAKKKLSTYGIVPPLHSSYSLDVFAHNIIKRPHCDSTDTVMLSRFGAAACKSLHKCNDCKEPFEYFKCH